MLNINFRDVSILIWRSFQSLGMTLGQVVINDYESAFEAFTLNDFKSCLKTPVYG